MRRFPLVHGALAALIDDAGAIDQRHILMRYTHAFDKFDTGNRRRAGTVRDNLDILHLAPGDVKRVDQAGGGDDGGAVLIIMKHRNFQTFTKLLFDDKAFRRLDVFKIDPAKTWRQHGHRLCELVGVPGVHLKVDTINVGEFLEQDRLAFHHRL